VLLEPSVNTSQADNPVAKPNSVLPNGRRLSTPVVRVPAGQDYKINQAGDTGNLLIESFVLDVDEQGNPIEVEQENTVLKELTALKRETRLTLKDMGLLMDPETQKAEAAERTINAILSESDN